MQTINNRLKQNFCKIKQYKIIKIHLKILQLKRIKYGYSFGYKKEA